MVVFRVGYDSKTALQRHPLFSEKSIELQYLEGIARMNCIILLK